MQVNLDMISNWFSSDVRGECSLYNSWFLLRLSHILSQFSVFFRVLRFPLPIKLISMILLKYCWKSHSKT